MYCTCGHPVSKHRPSELQCIGLTDNRGCACDGQFVPAKCPALGALADMTKYYAAQARALKADVERIQSDFAAYMGEER